MEKNNKLHPAFNPEIDPAYESSMTHVLFASTSNNFNARRYGSGDGLPAEINLSSPRTLVSKNFNQGFTEHLISKLSLLLLVTKAIGNFVFMQNLIKSIDPLKGVAFGSCWSTFFFE